MKKSRWWISLTNPWIHPRSPELVWWSSEQDEGHKCILLCLTRGSKISSCFSEKQLVIHTDFESQLRKASDTPSPILKAQEAIIYQKGEFFTQTVKTARITIYVYHLKTYLPTNFGSCRGVCWLEVFDGAFDIHPHSCLYSFLHSDARRGVRHNEESLFQCHRRERIQGKVRKWQEREGTGRETLSLCFGDLWVRVQDKTRTARTCETHARRRWKFENHSL